jgi:hypothetical protein
VQSTSPEIRLEMTGSYRMPQFLRMGGMDAGAFDFSDSVRVLCHFYHSRSGFVLKLIHILPPPWHRENEGR